MFHVHPTVCALVLIEEMRGLRYGKPISLATQQAKRVSGEAQTCCSSSVLPPNVPMNILYLCHILVQIFHFLPDSAPLYVEASVVVLLLDRFTL